MDHFLVILAASFLLLFLITQCGMFQLSISKRLYWIPEASLLMFCGVLITLLLHSFYFQKTSMIPVDFNSNLFYYLLLPPIIFNTGLDIDSGCFHQNLLTIMVYSNLGTIINAVVVCTLLVLIGQLHGWSVPINVAEGISFGALISATDPIVTLVVFDRLKVEQNLFGIVVGVSILDDAVAVVIFELFNGLIGKNTLTVSECAILFLEFFGKCAGSMCVGYVLGKIYAKYLKWNPSFNLKSASLIALTWGFVYLTYYIGDGFWMSGIITNLFSAIYFRKYYEKSFEIPYERLKTTIGGIAYLSECIIFVQIGMSLFSHRLEGWLDWKFFLWSIVACLIGRAAQIYPLAWLLNCYNTLDLDESAGRLPVTRQISPRAERLAQIAAMKEPFIKRGIRLPLGYQHMIFLAGLRGPIAYATAQIFDDARNHQNLIAATTALTVVSTTLIFGILTWPALSWFSIPRETESPAVDNAERVPLDKASFKSVLSFFWKLFICQEEAAVEDDENGISLHGVQPLPSASSTSLSSKKWEFAHVQGDDPDEMIEDKEEGHNNIKSGKETEIKLEDIISIIHQQERKKEKK